VSLVAVAANDSSNEGVDWSVCTDAATCGEFLVTPAIPATLSTVAVPPVYSNKLHSASGQAISYLPPTSIPGGGNVAIKAAATGNKTATISTSITIFDNSNGNAGVALKGVVQVGSLPVSGASVQLFAAGNTGYGSAASPLVINSGSTIVTTGTDGSFTIPAGYVCPAQNTELYLIAQGGAPSGGTNNPQLGVMSAIGQCSNLNSTVQLTVNEVTTIASTWALTPFRLPRLATEPRHRLRSTRWPTQ
jgi:hypothetical protein